MQLICAYKIRIGILRGMGKPPTNESYDAIITAGHAIRKGEPAHSVSCR